MHNHNINEWLEYFDGGVDIIAICGFKYSSDDNVNSSLTDEVYFNIHSFANKHKEFSFYVLSTDDGYSKIFQTPEKQQLHENRNKNTHRHPYHFIFGVRRA